MLQPCFETTAAADQDSCHSCLAWRCVRSACSVLSCHQQICMTSTFCPGLEQVEGVPDALIVQLIQIGIGAADCPIILALLLWEGWGGGLLLGPGGQPACPSIKQQVQLVSCFTIC